MKTTRAQPSDQNRKDGAQPFSVTPKLLERGLETPVLNRSPLPEYDYDRLDYGMVSYPDGAQAPDGTIYVSYDFNRSTAGHILLARFTEDDILAGRPVSSTARLKRLICRPLRLHSEPLPETETLENPPTGWRKA